MSIATTLPAWSTLPCRLDGGPPMSAAVGLITLAGDTVIEPDLRRFFRPLDAELYAMRIPFRPFITPETLREMGASISGAMALMLPDERLDVVAFGCTSGAIAIGAERIQQMVQAVRPGVPVVNPMNAALAAIEALGMKRVAVVTPYPDTVNAMIETYLRAAGVGVRQCWKFRAPESESIGRTPPTRVSPESIIEGALAAGAEDVDGVFLSCTGLRCAGIIEAIEARMGKPVVTSNQALAWQALRLAGVATHAKGQGRLFAECP